MKKIFIVAGEPSGDLHAARLMRELKIVLPEVEFHGIGGDNMEREGLKSLVALKEISVVGFWEVAKKYGFFKKLLKNCEELLKTGGFDAFIPVDYPGFNMRLAAQAKLLKIPVIFYIAPQLWAWGENRAKKLAAVIDKLLVVFPFEVEFFKKFGIDTEFVGHPLLDDPAFKDGFKEREYRIAFLPGSRRQEVLKHLPIMEETAKILLKELPDVKFSVAQSRNLPDEIFKNTFKNLPVSFEKDARALMQKSRAGLVKTGTSTLEAALCGMPFAMMYKTSPLSYHLSKYLVTLEHIALPNILLKRKIVPELIQAEATPNIMARELLKIVRDDEIAAKMQEDFGELRRLLGAEGASRRAAEMIAKMI
jgi:lipid-A-disaccharide synthase